MIENNLTIMVRFDVSSLSYVAAIVSKENGRVTHVAEPLTMVPVKQHCIINPTMTLSEDDAKQMMDNLWNAGLRPSHAGSASDIINAKDAHLEDMRAQAKMLGGYITRLIETP